MRTRFLPVVIAGVMLATACNDVPVKNLTSSYQVQIRQLREHSKPAKLDILWVVDDSTSMCQEQASLVSSFTSFLKVFQRYTAIDMRLAVTTTNFCEKEAMGAIRGKFVYAPAKGSFPPECVEKRFVACLNDEGCRDKGFPDPDHWFCDKKSAPTLYGCDKPAEAGGDLNHPGDILFSVNSDCRYKCDRESAPAACARIFGEPQGCKNTCKSAVCLDACTKEESLEVISNCSAICGAGEKCAETCKDLLPEASKCSDVCADPATCMSKCEPISKGPICEKMCTVNIGCIDKCKDFFGDDNKCKNICDSMDCLAACSGNTAQKVAGEFPKEDFLCTVICDTTFNCDDRCTAEFGAKHYYCMYPGDDKSMAGCQNPPDTRYCPPDCIDTCATSFSGGNLTKCQDSCAMWDCQGECAKAFSDKASQDKCKTACKTGPRVLDNDVVEAFYADWVAGKWKGNPSWKGLDETTIRQRVFEQIFMCMATVGTKQTTLKQCGTQEQGLLAAWTSLDPNGENKEAAGSFLRPDAYLLVVVVSDEDDCSVTKKITADDYNRCPCLPDSNGCFTNGTCGNPPGANQPTLIPSVNFINKFKSLKTDPAMVVFAAIVGDVLVGSSTSPRDCKWMCGTMFKDSAKCKEMCAAEECGAVCADRFSADSLCEAACGAGDCAAQCKSNLPFARKCDSLCNAPKDCTGDCIFFFGDAAVCQAMCKHDCRSVCRYHFTDTNKCEEICKSASCQADCELQWNSPQKCTEVCKPPACQDFCKLYVEDADPMCTQLCADTGKCKDDCLYDFATMCDGVCGPDMFVKQVRDRFQECRCYNIAYLSQAPPYVCLSAQGHAELGSRYIDVASGFGPNYGRTSNICDDRGLEPSLDGIARLVIPLLTKVCLPRPLSSNEFIEVAKIDASGRHVQKLGKDINDETGDYYLIENAPDCQRFDPNKGERLENAIQFRVPLEYADRLEITYLTKPFAGGVQ